MMFGFQPDKALTQAEKLVQQGKFPQAIHLYERLSREQPNSVALKNTLAELYVRVGRKDDACKLFRQVAATLEEQSQAPRAAALLKKVLRLEGEQPETLSWLARLLMAQGNRAEARPLFVSLLNRAENGSNWTVAQMAVEALLQIDPDEPQWVLKQARVLIGKGELPAAKARLQALGNQLLSGLQREQRQGAGAPGNALLGQVQQEMRGLDPEWFPFRLFHAKVALAAGDPGAAWAALPNLEAMLQVPRQAEAAWRLALECDQDEAAIALATAAWEAGVGSSGEMGRELLRQGRGQRLLEWLDGHPDLIRTAGDAVVWAPVLEGLAEAFPDDPRPIAARWRIFSAGTPEWCAAGIAWCEMLLRQQREAEAELVVRTLVAAFPADSALRELAQRGGWDWGSLGGACAPAAPEWIAEPAATPSPASEGWSQWEAMIAPDESPAGVEADLAAGSLIWSDVTPATVPSSSTPAPPSTAALPSSTPAREPAAGQPLSPTPVATPAAADSLLDDIFEDFRSSVEGTAPVADLDHAYAMGLAYREMGLLEESVAELQKVFAHWADQEPREERLLSCGTQIALCFQDLGQPALALEWYRRTRSALPHSPAAQTGLDYEIGRILEDLGRTAEALECYRQVYATDVDYQDVGERMKALQALLSAADSSAS